MKLCQGQTWKQGQQYLRIVRLERLEVEYKSMTSLTTKEGAIQSHQQKRFLPAAQRRTFAVTG